MQQTPINREARIVEIKVRQMLAHALTIQQNGIVALVDHGIPAPRKGVTLSVGMKQVDQPTLRMHHIIVQLFFQPFP